MQSSLKFATLCHNFSPNPQIRQLGCFNYHLVLHPVSNIEECREMRIEQMPQVDEMSFREIYRSQKLMAAKKSVHLIFLPFVQAEEEDDIKLRMNKTSRLGEKRSHQADDIYSCKGNNRQVLNWKEDKGHKHRSQQNSARASLNTNLYNEFTQTQNLRKRQQNQFSFPNVTHNLHFIFLLTYAISVNMPLNSQYKVVIKNLLKDMGMNMKCAKNKYGYKVYINPLEENAQRQNHKHKNKQALKSIPNICYEDLETISTLNQNSIQKCFDQEISQWMQEFSQLKKENAYKYCLNLFEIQLLPALLKEKEGEQIGQFYNIIMNRLEDIYHKLASLQRNNSVTKKEKQGLRFALTEIFPNEQDPGNWGTRKMKQNGCLRSHRANFAATQRINQSLHHSYLDTEKQPEFEDNYHPKDNSNNFSWASLKKYIRNKILAPKEELYMRKKQSLYINQLKLNEIQQNKNKLWENFATQNDIIDSQVQNVVYQSLKNLFKQQYNRLINSQSPNDRKSGNLSQIYRQIMYKIAKHIQLDYKCYYLMDIFVEAAVQNQNIHQQCIKTETKEIFKQDQQWRMEQNDELVLISRINNQQYTQETENMDVGQNQTGNNEESMLISQSQAMDGLLLSARNNVEQFKKKVSSPLLNNANKSSKGANDQYLNNKIQQLKRESLQSSRQNSLKNSTLNMISNSTKKSDIVDEKNDKKPQANLVAQVTNKENKQTETIPRTNPKNINPLMQTKSKTSLNQSPTSKLASKNSLKLIINKNTNISTNSSAAITPKSNPKINIGAIENSTKNSFTGSKAKTVTTPTNANTNPNLSNFNNQNSKMLPKNKASTSIQSKSNKKL